MSFDLDITELAKQLRKPEGKHGKAVGKELISHNQKKIDWLLSLLPLEDGQKLLEIGFGPGETIHKLVTEYPSSEIYGVDISDTMVEMASERNTDCIQSGSVHLLLCDASDMPFDDKKFDVIFLSNVAHFWEDLVKYFTEIRRCLKDSGTFGFYNADPSTWLEGIEDTGVFIAYNEQQFIDALNNAGFTHVDVHHFESSDKRGLGILAS